MSEYWKSTPRKFCDFCKCWITDNKPSVDFHERGKRHKENVELRLKEVRKKSLKDSYDKEQMDKEMEKMEKAAMEAFKKDLKNNPELAKQYGVSLEPRPKPNNKSESSTSSEKSEKKADKRKTVDGTEVKEVKEWYEAKSEEGYSYYWSTVTGASVWEAPEEYLSLEDQEKIKTTETVTTETKQTDSNISTQSNLPEPAPDVSVACHVDPSFSRSAFGAWSVVREEKQPQLFDESSEAPLLDGIPLPQEKLVKPERPAFKEKTVSSLTGGPVAFKKRKIASGARNVRQKGNDD